MIFALYFVSKKANIILNGGETETIAYKVRNETRVSTLIQECQNGRDFRMSEKRRNGAGECG
jgi:hypothetical protein